MSLLIKNFLSLLVNLRYDGRSFLVESNKYLNNVFSLIDGGEGGEYWGEILRNVEIIARKIGES